MKRSQVTWAVLAVSLVACGDHDGGGGHDSGDGAGASGGGHLGHGGPAGGDGGMGGMGGGGGHDGHGTGAAGGEDGHAPGGAGGHMAASVPDVIDSPVGGDLPDLARLEDRNPAEDVIEVDLVAAPAEAEYLPGRAAQVWAYNGTVPGPVIEARVGDRLVVHFRNELPEETTIHWHGVRVPVEMDGMALMHDPIAPGGTFDYEFVLPDAGTYWFHPHVRSDEQVERGLYGVIVVRGAGEPDLGRERVVVLDDVLVDEAGELASFAYDAATAMMGPPMIGRQGNLVLVNGRPRPRVTLAPGARERWRVLNVANARYFRLSLPGQRLVLVGTENGLLPEPRVLDELLLAPGERADVLVTAPAIHGRDLDLVSLPYDRGHGTGEAPAVSVLRLSTSHGGVVTPPGLPARLGRIEPLPAAVRARELRLSEDMGGMAGGGHGAHGGGEPVFRINGEAFPDVTPLETQLGAVEDWTIINESEMDHPFHLHGFSFQVLSRGGRPEPLAWKDTVNLRGKETLVLRVRFDDHPGRWMYHCHILEHAERGMIGEVDVGPAR